MTYNAGERKDVRRAEKEARLAEQQRREFMVGIMSLAPGRKWMLEKLEECHIFRTSYSASAIQMAYMEGERSVGLKLLNDIMASCPDEYVLMMKERNENATRSRTVAERGSSQDGDRGNQGPSPADAFYDGDGSEVDGETGNLAVN